MQPLPPLPPPSSPFQDSAASATSASRSPVLAPSPKNELFSFLSVINLQEYYDILSREGFDRLDAILEMQEADYEALGVRRGHRRIIQKHIQEFCRAKGHSTYQPFLSASPPHRVPFHYQHQPPCPHMSTPPPPLTQQNLSPTIPTTMASTDSASSCALPSIAASGSGNVYGTSSPTRRKGGSVILAPPPPGILATGPPTSIVPSSHSAAFSLDLPPLRSSPLPFLHSAPPFPNMHRHHYSHLPPVVTNDSGITATATSPSSHRRAHLAQYGQLQPQSSIPTPVTLPSISVNLQPVLPPRFPITVTSGRLAGGAESVRGTATPAASLFASPSGGPSSTYYHLQPPRLAPPPLQIQHGRHPSISSPTFSAASSDCDGEGMKAAGASVAFPPLSSAHTSSVSRITPPRPLSSSAYTLSSPPYKRKYKRHPKKDPNAPVRWKSAYQTFRDDLNRELADRNLDFVEMSKLHSEKWANLPPEQRKWYEDRAKTARENYERQMSVYRQTESYKQYQSYLEHFYSQEDTVGRVGRPKGRKNSLVADKSSTPLTGLPQNHRQDECARSPPASASSQYQKSDYLYRLGSPTHSGLPQPYQNRNKQQQQQQQYGPHLGSQGGNCDSFHIISSLKISDTPPVSRRLSVYSPTTPCSEHYPTHREGRCEAKYDSSDGASSPGVATTHGTSDTC